jgi:DNA-binding MarR family transcriptional regulator
MLAITAPEYAGRLGSASVSSPVPMAADDTDVFKAAEFRAGMRRFIAHSDRAARRNHLTPSRYQLLLAIHGAGTTKVTMGYLADRLQLAPSTVSELVDRAAEAGLVTRTAHPGDGRLVPVEATVEGRRRFAATFQATGAERHAFMEWVKTLMDD